MSDGKAVGKRKHQAIAEDEDHCTRLHAELTLFINKRCEFSRSRQFEAGKVLRVWERDPMSMQGAGCQCICGQEAAEAQRKGSKDP